jgi:hypothetical protein
VITCATWHKKTGKLPRHGIDISLATKELVDEFMANVDVLKFSGRIGAGGGNVDPNGRMCWSGIGPLFEYADSFEEIYDKNLAPFINARFVPQGWTNYRTTMQLDTSTMDNIWLTKKGQGLSKILSNCKNRCWDCHACEKVFGVEPFNSILEMRDLPANTADPADITISGDDLTMATNTIGDILVADGTNYNPAVVSGDISIGTTGVAAIGDGVIVESDIADNAVTLSKMAG